jgi:diacylglycerol kinase
MNKLSHQFFASFEWNMLKTFKYAINGLIWAFKNERNLKIHSVAAVIVCLTGIYLNINSYDWVILLLCIGLVISAELLNTAIEKTLDIVHPQISDKVKIIKDISAGAVLVLSLMAAIVGVVVLGKYL